MFRVLKGRTLRRTPWVSVFCHPEPVKFVRDDKKIKDLDAGLKVRTIRTGRFFKGLF
jgi:hypothetical protein